MTICDCAHPVVLVMRSAGVFCVHVMGSNSPSRMCATFLLTSSTNTPMVLHLDSTSSHTRNAPASVLRMCCLVLLTFFLAGLSWVEMVLTLSASCTVSSPSSHCISSSSASPSTFRERMPSSWLMMSLHPPPATCLSAGSEHGLTRSWL